LKQGGVMKYVYVLLILVCMTGCTFRDGAATTAASLSSGLLSAFGVQDSYGDMEDFWSDALRPAPQSKLMDDKSTMD
jgi:hypothetical protein